VLRVRSPNGYITMIPARKDLIDFVEYTEHVLTSIAIYEDKTFDAVLLEMLKEAVAEDEE